MKHRTPLLLAAALLVAAPALTGCSSSGSVAGGGSGGGSGPVGPAPTGPGQYRVIPNAGYGVSSIPPMPEVFVQDAAGDHIGLVIDPGARVDTPRRMDFRICPYQKRAGVWAFDIGACKDHLVTDGDTVTEAGLTIKVLRMWWESDSKKDALDVAVTVD